MLANKRDEGDKCSDFVSVFLHHVGKRESTLFSLLASVFSHWVFHCRGFNEVDEDLLPVFSFLSYWEVSVREEGVCWKCYSLQCWNG